MRAEHARLQPLIDLSSLSPAGERVGVRGLVSALLLCSTLALGDELTLLPSPGWNDELREDLALGLAAIPPAARLPLEVELRDEPRPLGLDDDPSSTRLRLYTYVADDEPRANSRLSKLTPDQRRRLWRRRAVVHALIRRWDARLRWSSRASWKALAGWDGAEPLLVYPWAFSRRRGMESAALDLATFAEELLVPAESMAPDAVPLDDRLRCREPSKARFLDERLTALDPSWTPSRACPAFEAWADLPRLPKFEVIFAAPSSSSAQALFGHLLLRIVREDDTDTGSMQVMQLAALISPFEPMSSYIVRGLSGGFRGVFSLTTMADVHQEALGLEQRSLRRHALELTNDQRLRLLERLWELERVGYIDYRFFKANCATMLRFLLTPALGEAAPGPTLTPWETPTQVLDGLASVLGPVQTDDASGLLAQRVTCFPLPRSEGGSAERWTSADEAQRKMRQAEATKGDRGEGQGEGMASICSQLSGDANTKRSAYRTLTNPGDDAWRAKVLLGALRIERFALDEATAARIKAERATVLPGWKGPTTDELVTARQRRFEQESTPQLRAQSELADLLVLDELLRTAPRRPPDPSELSALKAEAEARETFDAVAAAVASLPEEALSRAREEEAAALHAFQAETNRRSVPEGGHGHAELGAGVLSTAAPVLRLRAAALAEQLGDQRLRGFGARSAWRVIDATVELELAQQPVHRAGFTLLNLRTVGLGGWGWGTGVDYSFIDRAHEIAASGELLRTLVNDQRLTNFLMAAVGLRAGVRIDQLTNAVLYPRAGLAFRVQLPGSFGNAVRFEGAYLPRVSLGNGAVGFEHGASGGAQATLRLGVLGGVAFTARADLRAEWRMLTGITGLAALGFEVD